MSNSQSLRKLFESLHTRYHPMVLQLCLGFMKADRDLASELTQEVFIHIWTALPKFKGQASAKTWIYRITVNTCLLYIRDSRKRRTGPLHAMAASVEDNPIDVEDQKYHSLNKAIGTLPELDRMIIMLVLEELTYEEIATVIGIKPVHLRVKIHRIKQKLKQLMKQEVANG